MRFAVLLFGCTVALAAQAGVTVTFVEPDKFTDIGRFPRADRDKVQRDLRDHLVKLGERMPANQELAVEILDIDLAGEERLVGGNASDVRILRGGADWPSIRLRYTLTRDGRTESREVRLSDMGYQQRVRAVGSTETLPYEKRMLTDWFNGLKVADRAK